MKECFQNNPKRFSILGKELIPILKQFFGEFDPYISLHLVKIAASLTLFKGCDKKERVSFLKMALDHLKITHGIRHPLYLSTNAEI